MPDGRRVALFFVGNFHCCPSTHCDEEINLIEFPLTKISTLNIINLSGARVKKCVCVCVHVCSSYRVGATFEILSILSNPEEKRVWDGWQVVLNPFPRFDDDCARPFHYGGLRCRLGQSAIYSKCKG